MDFLKKFFNFEQPIIKGTISLTDRGEIRERWKEIEEHLKIGKPANLNTAIILSDKLLDFALGKIYPNSVDLRSRLILAKEKFPNQDIYEDLWYAHKIRNELVHKINFFLPAVEAKNVVNNFKTALETLGGL